MEMVRKGYQLRLFISPKYITANIMDRSNATLVVQASTIEHAIKGAFDIGRTTNPKAGAIVGEVLARRAKLEALHHHHGLQLGIYADVRKDVEKKGVDDVSANAKIVWAIINALRGNGIKIIVDEGCDEPSV